MEPTDPTATPETTPAPETQAPEMPAAEETMAPVEPVAPAPAPVASQDPIAASPAPVAAPMAAPVSTPAATPAPASDQTMVYAGIGKRFVALFLDGVVLGIVSYGISSLGGDSEVTVDAYGNLVQSGGMTYMMSQLISLVIYGAYYIYFIGSMGQTPGKRIMGIKVVTTTGEHPSFGVATMRYLVSLLSAAVGGLGYLWAFFNKEHQTWHDKAAGTYVVKA